MVVAVVFALTSCGSDGPAADGPVDGSDGPPRPTELVTEIAFARGAAPGPVRQRADGSLVVGERATGRIVQVPDGGDGAAATTPPQPRLDAATFEVVAAVDTNADAGGQRGLLGLTEVDGDLYAAWTRADDGHLVIAQVSGLPDDEQRLVWDGPPSTDLANGGHLETDAEGQILVGIGDLERSKLVDDPAEPNGKILSIDPAGGPDQEPRVLSSGWNNPYAFVVTENGQVWVADNAPGEKPERFGRGDLADADRLDLEGRRAPSALIDLGEGRFGVCSYLDGTMLMISLDPEPTVGDLLTADCKTGGVRLGDGLIAVADVEGAAIRSLPGEAAGG